MWNSLRLVAIILLATSSAACWTNAREGEASAQPSAGACAEQTLYCYGTEVVNMPPLNPHGFRWSHRTDQPHRGTDQLLALVWETDTTASYSWPLYVQHTTNHESGQSVGEYIKIINRGPGWAAGYHVDGIHQGTGHTIGVNVEVIQGTPGGRTIGVNIQNNWSDPISEPAQLTASQGLNLQGKFESAINLEGEGTFGVDMGGSYTVGLDMKGNNIRMNKGSKVFLEETSQISLSATEGRIRASGWPLEASDGVVLPPRKRGDLPECTSVEEGMIATVRDATMPRTAIFMCVYDRTDLAHSSMMRWRELKGVWGSGL